LYWDGLVGDKHVLYVPNAGHGLDDGKEKALTTIAVFAQHIAMQKPLPETSWKHDDDGDKMRLVLHSQPTPKEVRLWKAHSEDKDFRPDHWDASPVAAEADGSYVARVEKPASGHVAFFMEATYEFGPVEYNLSTQIRQH
jgi:PhoPQ-activated pathogenicity-related protein